MFCGKKKLLVVLTCCRYFMQFVLDQVCGVKFFGKRVFDFLMQFIFSEAKCFSEKNPFSRH